MRVAVTGASGLIGSALAPALLQAGHEVLSLVRRAPRTASEAQWDPAARTIDMEALQGVDAIVHLAGESIERRWTATRRRRILESRVDGTGLVAETVAALDPRPALLAASGVHYYGLHGDEERTERSPRGDGFLAEVAEAWEVAAEPAREVGARVVHLRHALVLSPRGGALKRLRLPFRLGLGGRVGSGRQWWSWVAIDDLVSVYLLALERPLDGIYNLAAPGPVRNADFVRVLGAVLSRPTVLPLPATAVRLGFGQMGEELLLGSVRAVPERLLGEGFPFAYPELQPALEHLLGLQAPGGSSEP
jgi:uncharacterized protein